MFVELYLSHLFNCNYDSRSPFAPPKLELNIDWLPKEHTYVFSFSLERNLPQWKLFNENRDKFNILYEETSINFAHPEKFDGCEFVEGSKYPLRCVNIIAEIK